MHQGRELKEVAKKQESVTDFAVKLGVSRDTLYKLFKRSSIPPKYVEKLRTMGISITKPDNTKSDSQKSDTTEHRRNRDSNGTTTYTEGHKTPLMSKMIALSLSELLQLQTEVHDVEMTKAISQVIQLKQRIEYLEKENGKLEHDNEFLKELIKKK